MTEEDFLIADAAVADMKPNIMWNGFKLVGDNLDKQVKCRRHQTMEHRNQDYHAFQYGFYLFGLSQATISV